MDSSTHQTWVFLFQYLVVGISFCGARDVDEKHGWTEEVTEESG
jgi:hypothetical protein